MNAVQEVVASGSAEDLAAVVARAPALDETTRLFYCAAGNDVAGLKTMIEAKPYLVWARLSNGDTPLHAAVNFQAADCVDYLLGRKADPNARNANAETPLIRAIVRVQPPRQLAERHIVSALLAAGADPNVVALNNETPLYRTLYANDSETATLLLNAGANPNAYVRGTSMLNHASGATFSEEGVALVPLLLQKGADVNALSRGVPNYSQGYDGLCPLAQTILGWQANEIKLKTIPLLLAKGAIVAVRDDSGDTVLHIAVKSSAPDPVLQLLLAATAADVQLALKTRNLKGETPLQLAVAAKKDSAATLLRAAGATE